MAVHGSISRRRFMGTLGGIALAGSSLAQPSVSTSSVRLGIDVLEQLRFGPLRGKRVGLLTHPAGVNRLGQSSIDVLRRDPGVRLVALFGPEHGLYGNEKADTYIPTRRDTRTGLPAYSLYGPTRKPTPEMLRNLDWMVIDLQDIGSRSYTYVSATKLTIEACFEQGVAVMVLDRPNPLGGEKLDGPMMEERWHSYVGAFPVPYVHGLTIGEIARAAKGRTGWLDLPDDVRQRGRLVVSPMEGWRRSMLWSETGLAWVPTSPAIPHLSAVLGYAMTGLGAQIGGWQHGYGTRQPFRLLTFKGRTPRQVKTALEARRIPGLAYQIHRSPKLNSGGSVEGVYVRVHDWERVRPTEISFHMMDLTRQWARPNPFAQAHGNERDLFNKHVGEGRWIGEFSRPGGNWSEAMAAWPRQHQTYWEQVRPFLLYS